MRKRLHKALAVLCCATMTCSMMPSVYAQDNSAGWVEKNGVWYFYENGQTATGWIKSNNKWYYMNADGVMQTGWIDDGGAWYYTNKSGEMQTGWLKDGSKWYYLNKSGVMQTGWLKDGSKWYYLNKSGVMQTGWVDDGGKWYYLNKSGVMQTGWVDDGGKWYYLNKSGVMQTGWVDDGGKWYYLNKSGVMQTGWIKVDREWYYLNKSGEMQTGWIKDGGTWYYTDKNGMIQTGWQDINSKRYYFTFVTGKMVTGIKLIDGKIYQFDESGALVEAVKNVTVFYDANGGTFDSGEETKEITVKEGIYYANDQIPEREGYIFLGWSCDGKTVNKINVSEDVSLKAQWEEAIAVTYDANGGYWQFEEDQEPFDTQIIYQPEGTYYPGWHEPEREGYRFDGWTIDGKDVLRLNLTDPITVKAKWSRDVVVSYDPNGGAWDGNEQPVKYAQRTGDYHVGYEWPEREGYNFAGWSTRPDAKIAEEEYDIELQDDTTFYAVWGQEVTLTYNANGGWLWRDEEETIGEETRTMQYGRDRLEGWRPDREAYEFVGWAVTKDGEVLYQPGDEVRLTEDTTLYAVWSPLPMVIYDANGGNWDTETIRRQWDQVGHTCYVGMDSPKREGFDFEGWVDEKGKDVSDQEIVLEEGMEYRVYAKWSKQVTVTYITNRGGWGWYEDGQYEQTTFERDARTGEYRVDGWRPNCVDEPYDFCGYSTKADADAAEVQPDEEIRLEDDLTLYAVWKKQPVVKYVANGGHWGDEGQRFDNAFAGRVYYIRYESPQREGYEFVGWADAEGNLVDEKEIRLNYDEEYTFTATWAKVLTVTYDANGGRFNDFIENDGETQEIHYRSALAGEEYEIDGWWPEREGYVFLGWALADGQQAPKNPEEIFAAKEIVRLAEEVTYYAVWIEQPLVTYDGNGGGWHKTDNGYEETCRYCDAMTGRFHVGNEWPEREGYLFLGWSEDPKAEDAAADWDTTLTGKTVFYAIWEKMPAVICDAGEGSFDEGQKVMTSYCEKDRVVYTNWFMEPEREGYRFDGWLLDGEPLDHFRLQEDVTLEASWVKICTVTANASDGQFENEKSMITFELIEGEYFDVNELEVPYRDGFLFAGWSIDGNIITRICAEDNMEITAIWADQVSFHYDFNGGELGMVVETGEYVCFGYDVTHYNMVGDSYVVGVMGPLHYDGYRFVEWNTKADGTGESYDNFETSIEVTEDTPSMTFYAIWEAVE